MRAIVAGGAGFIGARLVERLLERGDQVLVIDDLSTGHAGNVPDAAPVMRIDVAHLGDLRTPADVVFNLACPASPAAYQRNPLGTLDTCYLGTSNLLRFAAKAKTRFVQASTSEVYGNPLVHPQPEGYWGNTNPVGPRSCYDEGKRAAEALCFEHRRLGLGVVVARIFNTYGPRMAKNDGRVVSNIINQMLDGLPPTIHGDGSQTRSFCYVDDTVEALLRLAAPGSSFGPFNVGNPNEMTIRELAFLIGGMICPGEPVSIISMDRPVDDPERRCPDISRIRAEHGWEPSVGIRDGLRMTIDYFRGASR